MIWSLHIFWYSIYHLTVYWGDYVFRMCLSVRDYTETNEQIFMKYFTCGQSKGRIQYILGQVCTIAGYLGGGLCLNSTFNFSERGPRWQSGNTLASHLWGRGSIPVKALCGKAGSCLPMVGSLQYRTLANSMYWFPLPIQLPVVIWPVQCWKRRKTPNK